MVKDQEFLKSKASYCLDLAKKMGATDASVTVGHSISETVNFRNKSLEASDRSDGLALSIETYLGKKKVINFIIKFTRWKYKNFNWKVLWNYKNYTRGWI